jgi:hypothetical protein
MTTDDRRPTTVIPLTVVGRWSSNRLRNKKDYSMSRVLQYLLSVVLFLLGLVAWFAGAALVDTALLRGSETAQAFFIGLLADLQWSGRTIILIIGTGVGLCSLVELLAWPTGWLWRQAGTAARGGLALLWAMAVLVEVALTAWGFTLWAVGLYLAVWNGPAWGLWVVAILVAPLLAIGPEWLWRRGIHTLRTTAEPRAASASL